MTIRAVAIHRSPGNAPGWFMLACAVTALALAFPRGAQGVPLEPALANLIHQFTLETIQAQPIGQAATPGSAAPRIDIEVGQPDSRLHLAQCAKAEPYVPAGVRLGGATRAGLKCVQGSTAWNITVPVVIRIFGRGLVALSNIPAGAILKSEDLTVGDVDLVADTSAALSEPQAIEGRTLARPLNVGQSLRLSHLKPRQWFAPGDTVKLVSSGSGFQIASQGQALSPGIDGQLVRVRTEAGKSLSGTAVGDRLVALEM